MKQLLMILGLMANPLYAMNKKAFQERAQQVLGPLQRTFMQELSTSLERGHANSLKSCHLKAPHLMEGQASFTLGRTALKVRNPHNRPAPWLQAELAVYQKSHAARPMAPRVVNVEGKWAYVSPIYIKGMCLGCHGEPPSQVRAQLAELYPQDQAVGYKLGEFRGLFWLKEK